ncbi:porin family protein [Flavihumibacter petaseus]|uniref:Outer membrane protein beta-barrel domain-containing protein n=1 Tax=Flavihumibacter petaseus NBRC 106054 TaxID=1220578 RepID=A0A0E9MXX1_9BACT|nr:porin family protein [Flavihumibacter petaseus]GAO42424.1 hypothetical protein FPE01S_01_14390 [Flavihumibacter petaseus NBRC 106054]
MKTRTMKMAGMLLITAILAGATGVSAQEQKTVEESSIQPKFGVKVGLNGSNFYHDDLNDNNMKMGLNAGFFAKLPVGRGFSIQPELLYSNKGSRRSYNNLLMGEGEYRLNLHYLELPVMGVINILPNLNIQAGPYVGYLAAARVNDAKSDGSNNEVAELNSDNFNRFDFGVAAGIGVDIQHITLGARYNVGLTELGKSGSVVGESFNGVKNSNISVFVGVGF